MDFIVAFATHHNLQFDRVLGSALIFVTAAAAIFYFDRLLRGLLLRERRRLRFSYETILLTVRLSEIILWLCVGMVLLSFWGISVTGLWTILVSVSAVIGVGFLAVWTMISNITASLFITIWRPFHMGTHIEIFPENLKGRVIDRNMMFTVLREKEGRHTLYVPNNLFFQKIFRVAESRQQHLFEFFDAHNPEADPTAYIPDQSHALRR